MTNDELIRNLQITLSEVDRIYRRYDPENDLIPNAPRVTHTDAVALEAIAMIGGAVKELVNDLFKPEVTYTHHNSPAYNSEHQYFICRWTGLYVGIIEKCAKNEKWYFRGSENSAVALGEVFRAVADKLDELNGKEKSQ